MITTNNTISSVMLDDLKQCKGLMLDSVLCTDEEYNGIIHSIQVVVLRFQNFDIELWNEEQPDIPGELTDLAKIRVHVNPAKNLKSLAQKIEKDGTLTPLDFISIDVKKMVCGIMIHNDKVKSFDSNGTEQFELDNTRAIVISLGEFFLHIEKQCFWSEIWNISIKGTEIPEKSSEWENDEDSFYEVHSYSQEL